jgi:glucose-1-phosphate cytidylyltransferase
VKAVILAGGLGTRLSEETVLRPKPMVEVGGKPLLWHIMKIYSHHGVNDFIICCGYKGYVIKEFFANYFVHTSDVTFDLADNSMRVHQRKAEPWRVTLVDTGETTQTGGRLKRIAHYVEDEHFCFTYGDGVGDVDIAATIAFHRKHGRMVTVTATQPPGRFGAIRLAGGGDSGDDNTAVLRFQEKPQGDDSWINGGFFVLSRGVFDCLEGDHSIWEREPMERLATDDQVRAYFHRGFWQPMDTLRDKNHLEELLATDKAPWRTW